MDARDLFEMIPVGQEKAITREALVARTGMNDRTIRDLISFIRMNIGIVCSSSKGAGYYRPKNRKEILDFINETDSRARSTFAILKMAKAECSRDYDRWNLNSKEKNMSNLIRNAFQELAEKALNQLKYDWDRLREGKLIKQYYTKGKSEDESMMLIKLFMESDLFDSLCHFAGYDPNRWIVKNGIQTEDAYKYDLNIYQTCSCLGISRKTLGHLLKLEILKPKRTVIKKVSRKDKKTRKVSYRNKSVPLFDPREVEALALKAMKKTGEW